MDSILVCSDSYIEDIKITFEQGMDRYQRDLEPQEIRSEERSGGRLSMHFPSMEHYSSTPTMVG
jgi:hypothetical protein